MSKRIFFKVHGTVQGVNFRFVIPLSTARTRCSDNDRSFTQSKAQSYGLTGFVENKPNGKVGQGNPARAGAGNNDQERPEDADQTRWKGKLKARKMLCRSSSRTSTADQGQLTS